MKKIKLILPIFTALAVGSIAVVPITACSNKNYKDIRDYFEKNTRVISADGIDYSSVQPDDSGMLTYFSDKITSQNIINGRIWEVITIYDSGTMKSKTHKFSVDKSEFDGVETQKIHFDADAKGTMGPNKMDVKTKDTREYGLRKSDSLLNLYHKFNWHMEGIINDEPINDGKGTIDIGPGWVTAKLVGLGCVDNSAVGGYTTVGANWEIIESMGIQKQPGATFCTVMSAVDWAQFLGATPKLPAMTSAGDIY